MDQAAGSTSCSSENFIKDALCFEKELKSRLNWSKQQWISAGENGSRINKLSNSLQYWKRKLKAAVDDTSILVTLFNYQKDVKTDLFTIISTIESLDKSFVVEGFAGFRNPRYLCFYFKNKEIKDRVVKTFKMVEDNFVVYMSWALCEEVSVSTLSVHWLPLNIDINIIKKELDKFVTIIKEERLKLTFLSGRDMPTGKLSFKVRMKKDIKNTDIPHVTEIANMETLITINGRLPLCLNCNVLGHISKECGLRFCKSCRALKLKNHQCETGLEPNSYADRVKHNLINNVDIEPDDWGADIVVEGSENPGNDGQVLANKISDLEKQLKNSKAAEDLQTAARLDKKRKADGNCVISKGDLSTSDGESMEEDNAESVDWADLQEEPLDASGQDTAIQVITKDINNVSKIKKKVNKAGLKDKSDDTSKISETKPKDKLGLNLVHNTRSYSRVGGSASRRSKEEKQFDKMMEKREFVFKD